MPVPYLACMAATAVFYSLPPRVLPAIQAVEGGRVGMVHRNTDGSDDLGLMQVNTRWVPVLAAVTREPAAAIRVRLIEDPCFNIAAAGAILRTYLNEAQGDLELAVGFYHSHTPTLRQAYLERVMRSARAMFERVR
ncbi:MAG TPA: lytic transglycosylase domain-containing protein [Acetobacteraceae bacterium]|nr:lytic transglycosylase domain-containing protein [Acetobacteraceae bacterium]